jgi:hypothetical protein
MLPPYPLGAGWVPGGGGGGRSPSVDFVADIPWLLVILMALSFADGAARLVTLSHLINDPESPVKHK